MSKPKYKCIEQYVKLRKINGISVDMVAMKTGLNEQTIWSIEAGRQLPSLNAMEKLVRAVGGEGLGIDGWS